MTHRRDAVRRLVALFSGLLALGMGGGESHAQVSADETVKSFEVAEGLEATLWAKEPMLVNPTNIDIDSRGRVWVLEGANYRKTKTRPEGDRIVILEDTDHDGKADSQKIFAQDPALAAPLGIAVLGNKVYVSLSPNIMVYTIDESGDKPVGKPEVWIIGFAGANHDHGVHAIVFGPDGRLYFNAGNDGCGVKEPFKLGNGTPVVDSLGSHVPTGKMWRGTEKPSGTIGYQEGMAFRCNPDGTGFETLGHNFRNSFELAVDSFGTVWQSDNDDDGNEGARINYVMEGGNYGYRGPQGHDWVRDQAAFPGQSRQEAQWHQRWPGVVPNLLNTGGGSPSGILAYEGDLLPERFRGALIHCDPGLNLVRAYLPRRTAQTPVKKFDETGALKGPDRAGAGYAADVVNIVTGKDRWFRPSDVCVAPDGSLFIADWYDPGVGGHQTADLKKDEPQDWRKLRGRIYRVAPKGHQSNVPSVDLSSGAGQAATLKSPNLATRYLAYTWLSANTFDPATNALKTVLTSDPNPRYRARAVWLLAQRFDGATHLATALDDTDVDVRITAIRAARFTKADLPALASSQLQFNPGPAILRELALAMNYQPVEKAIPLLVQLANQFDGEDRWYLEAIGIGASGKEAQLLAAWEKSGTNTTGKAGDLIRWRLKKELPAAPKLDDKIAVVTQWWAAGPFDGAAGKEALSADFGPDASPGAVDVKASLKGLDGKLVKWERIETVPFEGPVGGLSWVDFADFCAKRSARTDKVVGYFATTIVSPVEQAAKLLVGSDDGCRIWLNGRNVFTRKGVARHARYADEQVPVTLQAGNNILLIKLQQGGGPSGLIVAVDAERQKVTTSQAVPGTSSAPSDAKHSPAALVTKDGSPLPPVTELAKLSGNATSGEAVFASATGANCIACHQVGDKGQMLGPPLTTIGQKLSKAQLYEAILTPSSGILMGYENWVVKTKKGEVVSGLKTSDTPAGITIKDTAGKYHDLAAGDIAKQAKQKLSIMPENLSQTMTKQELVDLVEYLTTLKNK